jgi:hypothetical protein
MIIKRRQLPCPPNLITEKALSICISKESRDVYRSESKKSFRPLDEKTGLVCDNCGHEQKADIEAYLMMCL